MLKLSYDLHIHSCLSPCGDEDMIPSNIVGMAALKNLDVIAVTDHNTSKNCPAILKLAKDYGITVIPGMELCTVEEVHVLCLFPSLSEALQFDDYVYSKLIKYPNNEAIFGKQEIYNEKDQIIGTEPNLLINAADISFDSLDEIVSKYHGIYIPAHIDKNSNSLLFNLGFVPPDAKFRCAEIKNLDKKEELCKKNPYLAGINFISDSDAHSLGLMNEPCNFLYAKSKNINDILESLITSNHNR